MGLGNLFDRLGKRREEKALKKQVSTLIKKYNQPEDRQAAFRKLCDAGTVEAICGLLQRFTVRIEPEILDEEEKERVCNALVELGRISVDPIKRFIRYNDCVTWPLRALARIVPPDEDMETVLGALREIGPDYVRVPEHKVELIHHLEMYKNSRIVEELVPFLDDPNDDVRFVTIEILAKQADERLREPLLKLMTSSEAGPRLKILAANKMLELNYKVTGHRPQVEAAFEALRQFGENFFVDKNGYVRKRASLS